MEENKSSAEVKTKSKKQEIVGIVILSIFLAISIVIFGIIWSFNIDDFMASLSGDKKDATVLVAAWVAILFLILFFS